MEKILLAVDGSEHALRAAQYVARLLRGAPQRALHVVHVEEEVPMRSHAFLSQDEIKKMYETESTQRCDKVMQFLKQEQIPHEWHLLVGHPAERVVELAKTLGADTIVLGSRGMGTVGSLVLGSVAMKVVHDAAVPVTIVK